MEYSILFEKINSEILTNEEVAVFCKKQLNDVIDSYNTSFMFFYTKLFQLLDILSDGDSLQATINFSQECIIISHKGRFLYQKELFSLYQTIFHGQWDILSQELEDLIKQDQQFATATPNVPVQVLQSLFSVLYRVDVVVENNYYSISNSQWKNADILPWQMMFHKTEIIRRENDDSDSVIVLYPNDIKKAQSELIKYPKSLLVFLKAKQVRITSNVLPSSFSLSRYKVLDNGLTIKEGSGKYWLVLPGEPMAIPAVNRKVFESDDNTPQSFSKMRDIIIDFAIEMKKEGYYDELYINKSEEMVLYKSSKWSNDLTLPFICNAPFIYNTENNIVLDSMFNRWLVSQLPLCYSKIITHIPYSLLKNTEAVNSILLKPSTNGKFIEIRDLLNESITNSRIPFIPSEIDGHFYSIDEVFINYTRIDGFDDLITKYLEERYSIQCPNALHGTRYGEGLIKLKFGIEDAIAIVTGGSLLAELEINRYAEFVVGLFLSTEYIFSGSSYFKEKVAMANNMLFPSVGGKFVHANEIVINNTIASIGNLTTLHHSIEEQFQKRNIKYELFLKYIKSLGAYEYITASVSGHSISFIEEGFRKTILFLDDNITLDSLPFLVEATENQKHELSIGYRLFDVLLVYNLNNNDSLFEGYMAIKGKVYRGIVNKYGKIIIPFGYERERSKLLEKNMVLYGNNNFWSSLFSLNGTELFPGLNDDRYGMRLCTVGNSDRIIVRDNHDQHNVQYSLLGWDLSMVPFEDRFYYDSQSYSNYNFVECGDGLIIASAHSNFASAHSNYDIQTMVINDQGKVILPATYDDVYYTKRLRHFLLHYSDERNCDVYDYDGNYRYSIKQIFTSPQQCGDEVNLSNLIQYPVNKVVYKSYESSGLKLYYGLITNDLNICFPIICDSITPLIISDLYRIEIDGKEGVFSLSNNTIVIPTIFDHVHPLGMHLLCGIMGCQKEKKTDGNGVIIKGGNKQIFTLNGESVNKNHIYDSVVLKGDYIVARESLIDKQRGKMGVFDEFLNTLVPFEYDYIVVKNNFFLVNNDGKVVYITNGKKIVNGGKWGVYSGNNAIIDCSYDKVICIWSREFDLFFKVKKNGKEGIIDRYGNICVPVTFDFLFIPFGNIVRINNGGNNDFTKKLVVGGKWFFYDMSKSAIISPELQYEYVGDISHEFIVFINNGKYGYLNKSFKVAIKAIFDLANDFDSDGKANVILDGKKIIIDKWANQIGEWEEARLIDAYESYEGSEYSRDDLDEMYRSAFEDDPDAEWNVD